MSSIGVVLDACVLFPGALRDTLLRAAQENLFRLHITEDILEEVRRNLVRTGSMSEEKAQYLINQIRLSFEGSIVTRHASLIPAMPINQKDRHVLAAAVASGAQIIVTQNLRDFPAKDLAPLEVEALSADEFLLHQFSQEKEFMVNIIRKQADSLKNPPRTPLDVLNRLESQAPNFAKLLRKEFQGQKPRKIAIYRYLAKRLGH